MSKRVEAAEQTDAEIAGLNSDIGQLVEKDAEQDAVIAALAARVTALESAPPVDPPVEPPEPVEPPNPAAVFYVSNFETGAIQSPSKNPDGWDKHAFSRPSEQLRVTKAENGVQPREGQYMFCSYYNADMIKGDPKGKERSELLQPGNYLLETGKEYWIGFSMFMEDNQNNRNLIASKRLNAHCFQFHQVGDTGTSGMSMNEGKWNFVFGTLATVTDCGSIELGRWNDFVFHCKVSTGSDGFCKMWINDPTGSGTPAYSKTGKSVWDANGISMKIGVYRTGLGQNGDLDAGGSQYARQYYDSWRLADQSGKYADVYPGSYA